MEEPVGRTGKERRLFGYRVGQRDAACQPLWADPMADLHGARTVSDQAVSRTRDSHVTFAARDREHFARRLKGVVSLEHRCP